MDQTKLLEQKLAELGIKTEADVQAYIIECERILCQKHFYYFVRRAWKHLFGGELIDGMHLAAMCYHLQALWEGQCETLIVNIPPGCSKSSVACSLLPAWLWIVDPSAGLWFSSFGQQLCDRDSLATRRLISSDWYQARWGEKFQILDDQNQKRRFDNSRGGWRLAASIEARTGFGEHPKLVLCVHPDDRIYTDKGSLRIEDIVREKIDVRVLSYNEERREQEWGKILEWEKNPSRPMVVVDCGYTKFCVTTDHPVFVGGQYIEAASLRAGQMLKYIDSGVQVQSVRPVLEPPEFVYNIRIEGNHNYFVNGVLVHNCDDPHDPSQAVSETERQTAIDYWSGKISTRGIVKGVKKCITAQRLHEDDLSGYVLATEDGVTHLRLPMEFEPEHKCVTNIRYSDIDCLTPDGKSFVVKQGWEDPRKEHGELMWPKGMDAAKVQKLKTRLRRAHAIAGQLQQRPTSPAGDMFQAEWFETIVDTVPTNLRAIRAWDKASTTGRRSDYTVGALLLSDGVDIYVADIVRGKWERKQRDEIIQKTGEQDAEDYSNYEVRLEREGASGGKDAADIAAEELSKSFRVKISKAAGKPKPGDSDEKGWKVWCDLLSRGRVKWVKGPFYQRAVEEHMAAPFGKHDDIIDACAHAARIHAEYNRRGKVRRPLLLVTQEEEQKLAELDAVLTPQRPVEDVWSILDDTGMFEDEELELGVRW